MNPDLKRHLEVHLKNPQHNYILLENCVHCKHDRRISFGLNYQNPRCFSTRHTTPITFTNLYRTPQRSVSQPVLNSFTIERVPSPIPINHIIPSDDAQSDVSSTIYGFGSIDNDRTYIQDVNRSSYVSIYLRGTKPIERCAICYDYLKSFQIIRTLNCEHYFHQKCADRWLEKKDNCPVCRYSIVENESY